MGGGAVVYQHSVLHLPSFTFLRRPKSGKTHFSLNKEFAYRPSNSWVRADGNRRERLSSKREGPENAQLSDGRSERTSSNKEEILALFKRIQASISKGENPDTKKRSSNTAQVMSSAESILEVLSQPRTRGKGKTLGRKGDKFPAPRKDFLKQEEMGEQSIAKAEDLKSTRLPSSFTRRSPIPPPSMQTMVQTKSEPTSTQNEQQSNKFEGMKLADLKEVAKSKGIRGYSKLKKSELLALLIKS